MIPEANRKFVEQHDSVTQNQFNGLLVAINAKVLAKSEFTEQIDLSMMELSAESATISLVVAKGRSVEQNQILNRELLNAGFAGILYSENIDRPYYYPMRAAYCFAYSLITWLLIFGCIGFSQNYFHRESQFWRYFSDSSYWFYLAHLPIQFQLLLWFGDQPWYWATKFTMYIVVTTLLLLISYHFLVRPTWIGWFLNGRMASVWKRSDRELVAATSEATPNAANSNGMVQAVGLRNGLAATKTPQVPGASNEANRPADNELSVKR